MWGLVIALLVLAYQAFLLNRPLEASLVESTGILYQWYWFWTGISLGFSALFVALFTFGGTAVAAMVRGNKLAALVIALGSFLVGGGLTVLGLLVTVVKVALQVGGAYLMLTAGTPSLPFAEWDMKRLVIGGIMVLVAAIVFRSSSSSSSSSRSSE